VAKQKAFLEAFRLCGSISGASRAAGISRESHRRWLQNETYRQAFEQAKEEANDRLVQEARSRAVDGVRRLKFTKDGKPIIDPATGEQYFEHVYSDVLLIFLMKGAMPAVYRERQSVEVSRAEPDAKVRILEDDDWYGTAVLPA